MGERREREQDRLQFGEFRPLAGLAGLNWIFETCCFSELHWINVLHCINLKHSPLFSPGSKKRNLSVSFLFTTKRATISTSKCYKPLTHLIKALLSCQSEINFGDWSGQSVPRSTCSLLFLALHFASSLLKMNHSTCLSYNCLTDLMSWFHEQKSRIWKKTIKCAVCFKDKDWLWISLSWF